MQRPSWRKDVLLLAGSIALLAGSVWYLSFGRLVASIAIAFSGVWVIYFAVTLLSGGSRLDPAHPQSAESIVKRFPEPTVVLAARRKAAMYFLFWLMIALIILLGPDAKRSASYEAYALDAVVIFFSGWVTLFAVAMFLMPARYGILLDADGFETRRLFLRRRVRWSDSSVFDRQWLPNSFFTMVTFDDAGRKGSPFEVLHKTLTGRGNWLFNFVAMPNDSLERLLNEWRSRALEAQRVSETKAEMPTRTV